MAVNIIDINSIEWRIPDKAWKGKVGDGEPEVQFKPFETQSDSVPRGQLVFYEPGHHEAAHSHDESEFLYILEGDCTVGDVLVTAGMLVHIEGKTVYGPLKGGPEGVRFLRLHLTD
jgi:hypothetical protein